MEEKNVIPEKDDSLEILLAREQLLEEEIDEAEASFSGLKDVELHFRLINVKLSAALFILRNMDSFSGVDRQTKYEAARKKALEALGFYEGIVKENVSLDQEKFYAEYPGFEEVKEHLKQLLLLGGGEFFENRISSPAAGHRLAEVVHKAIRKYISPDDRYEPLFKTEKLPSPLRRFMNKFFRILAWENQQDPPYGIEEGEEVVYHSEKIRMPLSQAIYFLEHEVLPQLAGKLAETPGDKEVQERIRITEEKLNEYKSIRFIPKSRPFVPETGYYTDAYSSYTMEGELMVSMPVSVKFRSGTNLERTQEEVIEEVVRNIAGKGIIPELDEEYENLKSLESGIRGSSRAPSLKVDGRRWFPVVKSRIPVLALLEDKQEFLMLSHVVASGSGESSVRYIRDLIEKGVQTDFIEKK